MYQELRAPLSVQIEVAAHDANVRDHHALAPDDAVRMLDRIASAKAFDIVITGDEPLLWPDTLRALVDSAQHLNLGAALCSSLTPFTNKDAAWLAASGVTTIEVPMHGPPALHDRITGQPGSFETTADGIRKARRAGIPVHASMAVHQQNKHAVLETARICEDMDVSVFKANKAIPSGYDACLSQPRLSTGDVAEYVHALGAAGLSMAVEVLTNFPLCGIADTADLARHGRRCLAGVSTLTITSDGEARPCPHTALTYGSIRESDLETIWARMAEWRRGRFLPDICRVCPAQMLCGGGCRVEAKNAEGDLAGLDPYAQPRNLPQTIPFLREREQAPANPPRAFSINPHHSREETLGTVLCIPGGAPLMLSPEGARVWRQFQPGRIYFANDPGIHWAGVEQGPFLAALERKKLISAR